MLWIEIEGKYSYKLYRIVFWLSFQGLSLRYVWNTVQKYKNLTRISFDHE